MKYYTSILFCCLCACQNKPSTQQQVSTIDSTLQTKVTSILESKLSEINAQSGQLIVMEVQTGEIKALIGLTKADNANYLPCENFSVQQPTGLMHAISILAALETRKVQLSDMVDTENGISSVHGKELKDHNWNRGGYGEISIKQGLAVGSNIATYRAIEKAFDDNPQTYFTLLDKMNYGKPDSITGIANLKSACFVTPKDKDWNDTVFAWFYIGYNQSITPIQMLTFHNAIANNGKMVLPQLYQDSTIVINPQVANKANIDSLKRALQYVVTDGLAEAAHSEKVKVAGKTGTVLLENGSYMVEFCGYFPADNPKYSIIVSINKEELPASGGLMAGDVFRQIVDYMN